MGFSSIDDFISEVSASAKFWRSDFIKSTGAGAYTAGRWYDLALFDGNPPIHIHGDFVTNGGFWGGPQGWTIGQTRATFTPATGLMTVAIAANVETLTQNTACVEGTTYTVSFTIGSYSGSGNIAISLGGTAGTNRTASNTYRENIICGADAGAPVVVTIAAAAGCTIDNISVIEALKFKPYTDATQHAIYHGGDVMDDTKHLVNFGAWTNAATGAPSVLMLVDMLGVFPRIDLNQLASQTLTSAAWPRYADGKGVRAFLSVSEAPGSTASTITLSYTNPADVAARGLGAQTAVTVSAIAGHIIHSGVAANNYGPFLPLAAADTGIKSVESFKLSAAMSTSGIGNLVMCRPIASIPITTVFVAAERDLVNQLPSLPRIYDGACLAFLHFAGAATAAATQFQGYLDFAWG